MGKGSWNYNSSNINCQNNFQDYVFQHQIENNLNPDDSLPREHSTDFFFPVT